MKQKEYNELILLSINAASKLMKLSSSTLHHLISDGRIGFINLNKRMKIPYKEIIRFINDNTKCVDPDEEKRSINVFFQKGRMLDEEFDSVKLFEKIFAESKESGIVGKPRRS